MVHCISFLKSNLSFEFHLSSKDQCRHKNFFLVAKSTCSSVCFVICVCMHVYVYSESLNFLGINCLKMVKKKNFYINAVWNTQKYYKNQHKNK